MMIDDDYYFERFEPELIDLAREHEAKMRGLSKKQKQAAIRAIVASADLAVAVVPDGDDYRFLVVRGELDAETANAFMADESLALAVRRGLMN
jgi:hypothetical protein